MSRQDEFTLAAGVSVYFCERASPWQQGTNENTNKTVVPPVDINRGRQLYSAGRSGVVC